MLHIIIIISHDAANHKFSIIDECQFKGPIYIYNFHAVYSFVYNLTNYDIRYGLINVFTLSNEYNKCDLYLQIDNIAMFY